MITDIYVANLTILPIMTSLGPRTSWTANMRRMQKKNIMWLNASIMRDA